jgi:hypothetical protein
MAFRFAAATALVAVLLLAACDDDSSYPSNHDDDAYDLEAMSLAESDVPRGMVSVFSQQFDNQDIADVFQEEDPEAKVRELDARGRLRSHIQIFSWGSTQDYVRNLARVSTIYSQSSLFVDEKAAAESMRELCDLQQYPRNRIVDDLVVPKLADESTGLLIRHDDDTFGELYDVAICFRTGRLVHSVVRSGLPGTEDVRESLRLARIMLRHVEAAYPGRAAATAPSGDGG